MKGRQPTWRRGGVSAAFVVVSAVLLLAGITLMTSVDRLKLHFRKEPVPQPRDFHDLPPVMGKWLQVSLDKRLAKETEDTLATNLYVYRDYLEVPHAGADLLIAAAHGLDKPEAATQPAPVDDDATAALAAKFAAATFQQQVKMLQDMLGGKTGTQRQALLYAVEMKDPGQVIHLGLTYYTGLVDTVAHIPDRCYIAEGYEPSAYEEPTWALGPDARGHPQAPLRVRFITFEDQTGRNLESKCVAYVFNTDGHYDSDPIGVRITMEDLTQRYGYYAKIEMMTLGKDSQVASAGMTQFLTDAKEEIETCFPDWNKVVPSHH